MDYVCMGVHMCITCSTNRFRPTFPLHAYVPTRMCMSACYPSTHDRVWARARQWLSPSLTLFLIWLHVHASGHHKHHIHQFHQSISWYRSPPQGKIGREGQSLLKSSKY